MTIAYILIFVICVLLILVVLVQNSKGGGLASGFTGSQVMGVRKTADFLEKATWTLASALLLFCVVANLLIPRQSAITEKSMLQDEIKNAVDQSTMPKIPNAVPQQGDEKPASQEPQEK